MKVPIIHNQIRQKSLDLVVQEIKGAGGNLHLVFLNGTTDQEVENRNTPTGFGRLLQKAEIAFDITDDVKYAVNNSGVTPDSRITDIDLGGSIYYTLVDDDATLSNSIIVNTHNESGIYWLNLLANPKVNFTSTITYDAIAVVMNYDNVNNTGVILMAARTAQPVEQEPGDKFFPIVITF